MKLLQSKLPLFNPSASALVVSACLASSVQATSINLVTGTISPSFRGDSATTWTGWDTWDDAGAGDQVINDSTPDVGTDGGSFVTTNGEDHLSGSFNYYTGSGSVAETVNFSSDGIVGTGFTTVIMQGHTLFGGFGTEFTLSDVGGVSPEVVFGTNANGQGQFWAKYELPGNAANYSVDFSSGPSSFVSLGIFEVDTLWSSEAFSFDSVQAVPEPSSALFGLLGVAALLLRKRRS